ncbi:helix-turn-helix domain-containing protein [Palleronia pelagia]|uniref:AraC family transcriptional regulator, transcriptional activator of pobA n=1 Tax=Palleronia pelagia TaxID=387096 RepID=A0A1H8DA17_9RHOB|nr:helix-turn-helix domain-containing protein [Palleronia pelagia]SEN04112.1 AraC family transcriptional regulator, transcriptional activator of pobA [Palleronia pelagia]
MSPGRAVPSFELYGEWLSGRHTDPIHHETIRERSSQHDWTIRLHRHRALAQVFLFRTDTVSFRVEDAARSTAEPHILFVPPGIAHGFRFREDVDGDVLSFRVDELGPAVSDLLRRPALKAAGILPQAAFPDFAHTASLFDQVRHVYHGMAPGRSDLLAALTQLILAYVSGGLRQVQSVGAISRTDGPTRHEARAEAFCALVETHFNEDLAVGDYAAMLDISAPHLTRLCRAALGLSPNELVRQRRLLEAMRLLEYTRLSVAEIAHRSGFQDPAFFSRTFRRAQGVPPTSYREQRDR